MGVAGLIFERHPPSFEKQYNFCRYTNDITMTFWYIYWFQSFKKSQEPRSPFLKGSMPYSTRGGAIMVRMTENSLPFPQA